jgi:uncharacterized protein YjdB
MKMKNKIILGFCGLLVFGFLFIGCDTGNGTPNPTPDPTFVAVTNISCPQTVAIKGQDLILNVTVEPSGATNKTIIWSGEDVNDGKLTASSAKTYTVTATVVNGASESSSYTKTFSIVAYDTSSNDVQNPFAGKTFVMAAEPPDVWIAKAKFNDDDTWDTELYLNLPQDQGGLINAGVVCSGIHSWTGGTGITWTITYVNDEILADAEEGYAVPKVGETGIAILISGNKMRVANFNNSIMNGDYDIESVE